MRAQQRARPRRVAFILPYPESDVNAQARARILRQELATLGWSDGVDLIFDIRFTTDDMDIVRATAAKIVQSDPDVIASSGDRVLAMLQQLTRSIPIVATASDLVGSGFANSLARPSANVLDFPRWNSLSSARWWRH